MRTNIRKTTRTLRVALAFALLVMAMIAAAAGQTTINVNSPGKEGVGYLVSDRVITINKNGEYVLTGATLNNSVRIDKDVQATVTLDNVSITSYIAAPIAVSGWRRGWTNESSGNTTHLTLILMGDNKLVSTVPNSAAAVSNCAALQVEYPASLTIEGEGSLTAMGDYACAGIGGYGSWDSTCGPITINSGTIVATGGWRQGAGIGGGHGAMGGHIVINGGHITATGGDAGAGIGGGGSGGHGGYITINGGTVIATGGVGAAGIGGGGPNGDGDGGDITINGGSVAAIAGGGSGDPAAIGGGAFSSAGNIQITGGNVFAWGASGAGIGGGVDVTSGSIRIADGTIVSNTIGLSGSKGKIATTISDGLIYSNAINATAFGNATIISNLLINEAVVRALAAAAPRRADTLISQQPNDTLITGYDTLTLTDTLPRHDTLFFSLGIDTLPRNLLQTHYDTLFYNDTVDQNLIRRDTLPRLTRDTLLRILTVRDTAYNYLRDTLPKTLHLPDTLPADNPISHFIVLNDLATSLADPPLLQPLSLLPAGNDLYYLIGLEANIPFALFTPAGAIVYRGIRQPVRLPQGDIFIVEQSGRFYKVAK